MLLRHPRHDRDVHGTQQSGDHDHDVPRPRGCQAPGLGQQRATDDRECSREIEAVRHPIALHHGRGHDGQRHDQARVGRRCHGHAVGFRNTDRGQEDPADHTRGPLGAGQSRQPPAQDGSQHRCREGEPHHQKREDRVGRGDLLGGQIARSPHHSDGEQTEVGGALGHMDQRVIHPIVQSS